MYPVLARDHRGFKWIWRLGTPQNGPKTAFFQVFLSPFQAKRRAFWPKTGYMFEQKGLKKALFQGVPPPQVEQGVDPSRPLGGSGPLEGGCVPYGGVHCRVGFT